MGAANWQRGCSVLDGRCAPHWTLRAVSSTSRSSRITSGAKLASCSSVLAAMGPSARRSLRSGATTPASTSASSRLKGHAAPDTMMRSSPVSPRVFDHFCCCAAVCAPFRLGTVTAAGCASLGDSLFEDSSSSWVAFSRPMSLSTASPPGYLSMPSLCLPCASSRRSLRKRRNQKRSASVFVEVDVVTVVGVSVVEVEVTAAFVVVLSFSVSLCISRFS
mmetsp:Transcript_30141/g.40854  ORF Transcript_30141/g.40854 Transcript_30141/m.40854 type:complete len:219 (+) Transcript_30141:335-991(+)